MPLPCLVSRFDFKNPGLLRGRVRLGADALTLTGWTWHGRYRRCIPFDRILHVDARSPDELILWLFDGEALRLCVHQAGRWKTTLNALVAAPDAFRQPLSS